MSAEDLAQGLRAIDQEDVRHKVAAGDLAAAGDLDLTEEEAGLLRGAADDYPEVAGFAFEAYLKLDDMAGMPKITPTYNDALQYLQGYEKP